MTQSLSKHTFAIFIGLLVTLPGLSAHALDPGQITVEVLAKTTQSWNGATLPAYGEGQPEVTMLRIVIPPGAEVPDHRHPVINAGVLLKGRLTVITAGGETLHLNPGDPIVEVVDTWHRGLNDGPVPAEIIVFYAGIEARPLSVKRDQ